MTKCSVLECPHESRRNGLCPKHSSSARRKGEIGKAKRCLVNGCYTSSFAKGMCNAHYLRVRTKGSLQIENICENCGGRYEKEKIGKAGKRKYCPDCSPTKRSSAYIRRYGITINGWDELYTKQNGKCAICSKLMVGQNCVVDHCHTTGQVRGLLCISCNVRLSGIENNQWYSLASEYLKGGENKHARTGRTPTRVRLRTRK